MWSIRTLRRCGDADLNPTGLQVILLPRITAKSLRIKNLLSKNSRVSSVSKMLMLHIKEILMRIPMVD